MSVSDSTLLLLESHWAVSSIPDARRQRALEVARYRLVQGAIGRQMTLDFSERLDDQSNLERVAMAYEIAAIEGIDAWLHPSADEANKILQDQAQAGAFRAYELRRALPIPTNNADRAFHILHRGALAYCSDQWTDLRRWLKENPETVSAPSVANAEWDERVLYRTYDCWIRLFRKNQWDDLDRVREIVAGLRVDQKQYEATLLDSAKQSGSDNVAYRLIALYHWTKATEQLAVYMLQGAPPAIDTELDQHFESARSAAQAANDASLDVMLRWLHVASRRMVASSIWWVAQKVNSRVSLFVNQAAKRSMFELLPPQRAALQEQGLLDQANQAVIVNLPTSGGKTVLAQFRMLQALNQFADDNGWIAYVAPTRALVSQVTRRLRSDFEPLDINVEYLSAAVDLDGCERVLLQEEEAAKSFHILVSTPEKLNLLIRNQVVQRTLALVVMDEAHNIEDEDRGLRVELLLATIKRDCPRANYLLLMPHVPNANDLANWLGAGSGRTISIGTSAWQPNERIVGLFDIEKEASVRGGWQLQFETLTTTPKTLHLKGHHKVGGGKPLNISYSTAKSPTKQAGAMARVFSERGTSIAVAKTIPHCWSLARTVAADMPVLEATPPEIELAIRFLKTEISENFELVEMLRRGVGVHHAGLSEETRALVEWLTESGKLRVLCATTTIAQGINFPVASVFLASRSLPARNWSRDMSKRAFWNLAGRAGRVGQDTVGVVGLAGGNDRRTTIRFVQEATEELVSRLVAMLREIDEAELGNLIQVIHREQWSDFRSYIAHIYNEAKDLNKTLAETKQALRNTFGYGALQANKQSGDRERAGALLEAATTYVRELDKHPENASLADATGFDPEGVRTALLEMNNLTKKLKASDWQPESLFGNLSNSVLPQLVGVMMQIPQIRKPLEDIAGSKAIDRKHIAALAKDWVGGKSIKEIAQKYFASTDAATTDDISNACKGIYRALANAGTWGLAALSHMGTSGLDFENMTEEARMVVNNLPAMLYHGVNTEAAVLMRINAVPRSIATRLGDNFTRSKQGISDPHNSRSARNFLRALSANDWQKAAPSHAKMSGTDYRDVWRLLSGERS
jgi:replicative superfamily II helicase